MKGLLSDNHQLARRALRDTNLLLLIALLLFSLLGTACGGSTADAEPPQVAGPALVMFYTDN